MTESDATFVHLSSPAPKPPTLWPPILIRAAQIEAEVARLADTPVAANGRRQAIIAHPNSRPDIPTLAPGIRVTVSVLKPGENTAPFRHNASEVNFCIRGRGHTEIAGDQIDFCRYDLWNHPSYAAYRHVNVGDELLVLFTYSNAPLLEYMEVHLTEEEQPIELPSPNEHDQDTIDAARYQNSFGTFELSNGAMLMPYERLISPPPVESRALHWPWKQVKTELDKLSALGKEYRGRRLYLMYNPMTGRSNGTTPSFFATLTVRPPNIVDRPHRHVSAAINYYFHGSGYSVVQGERYEWNAGDLMLSAPGWAVHNHASYDQPVYELTVQDQPLNIMMESLLWQESMKHPPALLGTETGFSTNRRLQAAGR